jgi:hypothetical protein
MTNVALRANRYLTWRRVFRTAAISVLSFAIAVVAVMVLRGFGVGPAASLLAAGRLHGRERLLITDFAAGKDSSLSHVVTEAVRTNLGQSKAVSIMPPTAIAAALQRMQRPASGSIDIALGREIAVREGVKALVGGSITPLGSGYVVSIRLVSADSGSDLAAFQKTVNGASAGDDGGAPLSDRLVGRVCIRDHRDPTVRAAASAGRIVRRPRPRQTRRPSRPAIRARPDRIGRRQSAHSAGVSIVRAARPDGDRRPAHPGAGGAGRGARRHGALAGCAGTSGDAHAHT